jgi:hypothetical protein
MDNVRGCIGIFRRKEKSVITGRRFLFVISFLLLLVQFPSIAFCDDRVYDEGTVWMIIYVRTKPGMFGTYMENLNGRFRKELDVAIKKGFLLDYKIIKKWPANPDDWDVMIMEEYPNMASFDEFQKKWDEVDAEVFKTLGERDQAIVDLDSLRTILGRVITREQIFKTE